MAAAAAGGTSEPSSSLTDLGDEGRATPTRVVGSRYALGLETSAILEERTRRARSTADSRSAAVDTEGRRERGTRHTKGSHRGAGPVPVKARQRWE